MTRPKRAPGEKPLFWTGSSKDDLLAFPDAVIDEIGTALSPEFHLKSTHYISFVPSKARGRWS